MEWRPKFQTKELMKPYHSLRMKCCHSIHMRSSINRDPQQCQCAQRWGILSLPTSSKISTPWGRWGLMQCQLFSLASDFHSLIEVTSDWHYQAGWHSNRRWSDLHTFLPPSHTVPSHLGQQKVNKPLWLMSMITFSLGSPHYQIDLFIRCCYI